MALSNGVKWYYELCGAHGVWCVACFRVFGKPKEMAVVPRHSKHPIYLRLDTSDFCSYRDVLICKTKSYDPRMPGFVPKTIVDVGAHIGMASIQFCLKYPTARVFAVEPHPENYSALVRNTAHYKTIIPIQAALWRQNGEVTLGPSKAHPKGAFQVIDNGHIRVRALTMDTLMQIAGIDSIDLLKIDIEGAENEVFKVCSWIHKVRILAIELHDRVQTGCTSTVMTAASGFYRHHEGEVTSFVRDKGDYDFLTGGSSTTSATARTPGA